MNILIVDDHAIIRDGLKKIMADTDDLVVAGEAGNGNAVLFQKGDTGTAVRASSAVPAVFVPVKINGREYVDGGLVSPVPVRFARQMGADLVIAVDISNPPEGNAADGSLQILLQTFAIMGRSINHYELTEADVVVRPKLAGISSADWPFNIPPPGSWPSLPRLRKPRVSCDSRSRPPSAD